MNTSTRNRNLSTLLLAGLTAVPGATALTSSPAAAASAHVVKAQTFKGPLEYVDHGPVQVSIVVKSKKITDVKAAISPQDGRSQLIQSQAMPLLRREVLAAQSARISVISGATDTSEGYISSLQAAVSKARKAKALK
jgi:uncharacterized protein with FMN-binding domain